ncbi:MAG: magnesium/cobalt transporter CorA [Pyrinomonadaceae bacterium]|nr:magnesium/cobalt transporter CorA [Pyrinomonadaceae bacterium]MBP6214324.1 magnesium/cobalt transporter CorA [Pyrinomonadaceae bacterium]
MEILVYKKGAASVEEGFTRDDLPELIADQTNVVWVDLQGETEASVEEAKDVLLNIFKFHHLTVEDCVETRNQPKVEGFPDYLYFIVHGVKPEETNPTNFVTKELDGYLGSNFVVTFHVERFRSIRSVKQQVRSSPFVCQRGAAFLLQRIIDEMVDYYMPIVDDFDIAINTLEDRVLDMRQSNNAILGEIMDLRRSVARLKRISSRQLEVLYRMSHGEFPQIDEHVLPFFRDVHDHLQRISDLAEGYRDLVGSLFDIHFAVVGNKTNDVMKTLAVLSAILLPLTLLSGIYGMNFDVLPGKEWRHGYWAMLGFMVFITIALLVYFWRRGWIFQREPELQIEPPHDESAHGNM